jgi:hypothetical protein
VKARRAPRIAPAFDLFEPAPAALVVVPDPVPEPPAWAVEAATAPASAVERRDFAALVEEVQRGDLLVIRTRLVDGFGYHRYEAWERATAFFYDATRGELTWGRIDARRPIRAFDSVREYGAGVAWLMACQAEARVAIRLLCPETCRAAGESTPESGVYDGPGYVLITTDPEHRHRAALARRRPT